jgi:hypothetical protein
LTDKVKKVYTLIIKLNEANKMKTTMTIEVTTKTDWADVDFPCFHEEGIVMVSGMEYYPESQTVMALDGTEFPIDQIDEANQVSAQYLYDNQPEKYDPSHWSNGI